MVHVTLEQGSSIAVMLAVWAGALGLAAWFYRRVFGRLPRARWRWLFLLRAIAIGIVVLLLFRPVLSLEREIAKRRTLILLVDRSASMNTADDTSGKTRFEQARARVLEWAGKLGRDFDLKVGEFSDRAAILERPGDLSRVKPTGTATSLTRASDRRVRRAGAIGRGRRAVQRRHPQRRGRSGRAGAPRSAWWFTPSASATACAGARLTATSASTDWNVPSNCRSTIRATITAHLSQTGLAGELVKVSWEEDGKAIGTSEVELKGVETTQDVSFQFTPSVKGRHTYTVPHSAGAGRKDRREQCAVGRVGGG